MTVIVGYTPFTRWSKHQANVEQRASKHRAKVKQTSNKHQAIRAHIVHVYFEYICL